MSRDIWNRHLRFYDPGVNPQPRGGAYRHSGKYTGPRSKHDFTRDGQSLDAIRIKAAKTKRARKAAIRLQNSTVAVSS